uniref:UBX domain-containing protein 11 n=1 Tax=Sparus aurata TaxID=8175 RepID=A0A671W407_SPAAU
MFDGPFRSYQENSTQRCMQDLMAGYFPSELQGRFPDGVPFEVCFLLPPWDRFPGEGQAVRGGKGESGKKMSVDQFVNRLPKVIVKAGRVIDIRDSVRGALQVWTPYSAPTFLSVLCVLTSLHYRLQVLNTDRPASARDVITLKVKSEDGNHTFILKMCLLETIGHVLLRGGLPGYDIISVYPQCCYDDDCQTLKSCGLTTNATLLLRMRKHLPHHSLTEAYKINS